MNAIILAGGTGTRMQEYSELPKVLLPVRELPLIEHGIRFLLEKDVNKIFVTLAKSRSALDEWLTDKSEEYSLTAIRDSQSAKGNSYGVLNAMKDSDQTTYLAYGDTIFNFPVEDMLKYHINQQNDITVLVRDSDHPRDSDLAWEVGDSVGFSKYPHGFDDFSNKLGVSAFYILSPMAINPSLSEVFPEWFQLLQHLNEIGKKIGLFKLGEGYIKDLGTPERYLNFTKNDNY